MPEPTNIALATKALTKVAETAAKEAYSVTKGIAKSSFDKMMVEFGIGFKSYIDRNYEKCRYVKTLLHRVDPIPIESAYINPRLKIRKKTLSSDELFSDLSELKRIVIAGPAGSGKSMFMKNAFIELCNKPFGRIPILIELRDLNNAKDNNIFIYIHRQWVSLIPSFTIERMEYSFKSGKYVLLLDGLDEVNYDIRDDICRQILEITYKYSGCLFMLTSRPDDVRFSGWNEFYIGSILPFDKNQLELFIRKIDFDTGLKDRFLAEVKRNLLATHQEFLSNPLLCTMMLMTYNEFEEVPAKRHIFYSKAFDVLFTRHDRMKPSFRRKFYTDLAEDDFRRVFSTFCLFSFLSRDISLNESTAKRHLQKAIEFENCRIDADDLLQDLYESISILIKDGTEYSFIHRSFQEYFVAVFLSERTIPAMVALFDVILEDISAGAIIDMLIQMNKDAFEAKYFAAKLKSLIKELQRIDAKTEKSKIIAMLFYSNIELDKTGRSFAYVLGKWYNITHILSKLYPSEPSVQIWRDLHQAVVSQLGEVVSQLREIDYKNEGKVVAFREHKYFNVASIPLEVIDKTTSAVVTEMVREILALRVKLKRQSVERRDFVARILAGKRLRI